MSNIRKTLQMTSLLFGMTTLFCYIAWTLGYEGFIIVGDIDMPSWLNDIFCVTLLCVNLSLYAGFVLDIYSWKILRISIPLVILSGIGARFFPGELFTGPIPCLVFAINILYRKLDKQAWKRLIIMTGSILVWNLATSKFSMIDLSVNISVYQALRLSINSILLHLLFYSMGGAKYYEFRLEQLVFPGRTGDERSRNEIRQPYPQSAESIPVDKFERWVMRSVIALVQVIQWMFILWVCSLDNLFLDTLVMTTSFICHGMIVSKRQHLKPIILCTLAATAMFYFAARFTISFRYSQFFPIVIGLVLVYTMYRISYQFDLAVSRKVNEDLKRIKALEVELAKAWDDLDELS